MKMKNLALSTLFFLVLAIPSFSQPVNQLNERERKNSWKMLFNGTTMDGWRFYKNQPNNSWEVVDGTLHCKNVKDADKRSDLMTKKKYKNFVLTLDWKIAPASNSGIIYHVSEDYDAPYLSGPEYQLIDDRGYPEMLTPLQKSGADYDMYAAEKNVVRPVGQYNTSKLVVQGNHVEHWLNGVKVLEFEQGSEDWKMRKEKSKWKDVASYGMTKNGYLTLQDHGGELWLRNIKIRKL